MPKRQRERALPPLWSLAGAAVLENLRQEHPEEWERMVFGGAGHQAHLARTLLKKRRHESHVLAEADLIEVSSCEDARDGPTLLWRLGDLPFRARAILRVLFKRIRARVGKGYAGLHSVRGGTYHTIGRTTLGGVRLVLSNAAGHGMEELWAELYERALSELKEDVTERFASHQVDLPDASVCAHSPHSCAWVDLARSVGIQEETLVFDALVWNWGGSADVLILSALKEMKEVLHGDVNPLRTVGGDPNKFELHDVPLDAVWVRAPRLLLQTLREDDGGSTEESAAR